MEFETRYANPGPTLAELATIDGAALLEFGTPWCGWCRDRRLRSASIRRCGT
jgi:thioredoxin 1